MRSEVAISVIPCDWDKRRGVVDEPARAVLPAAVTKAVRKHRPGCCSPALPPDPDVGQVKVVAPHTRGGDCFGRDQLHGAPVELRF